MAHDMQVDALPPMVLLAAVEEDQPVLGRDYFDVAPRFGLFNTPCAIARLVKTTAYDYRMVVSAEESKDLDDKPLTYHWALLRGDSAHMRINKLNAAGSRAEIIVSYHERRPIAPDSQLQSNRVDIGVFVHNGRYYSAPGFVCLQYLANERRVYDDHHRIQVVDYTGSGRQRQLRRFGARPSQGLARRVSLCGRRHAARLDADPSRRPPGVRRRRPIGPRKRRQRHADKDHARPICGQRLVGRRTGGLHDAPAGERMTT